MSETAPAQLPSEDLPVALTIATSDSGSGAGIQADLLTFAARGVYGITAFACLTAQNPNGVSGIAQLQPEFLRQQLDQNAAYFNISAVKTGMLFSEPYIEVAARFLRQAAVPVVVDPVMVAASGAQLLEDDAVAALEEQLLPLATLITPNLDEAAVLLNWRPETAEDMKRAAWELQERYGCAVLVKGGHLGGDELVDVLRTGDGSELELRATRIPEINTHGSGCTLASAITAELAKGLALAEAVTQAHAYLQKAIAHPVRVSGEYFISHGA